MIEVENNRKTLMVSIFFENQKIEKNKTFEILQKYPKFYFEYSDFDDFSENDD